jgi:hypothetical protein
VSVDLAADVPRRGPRADVIISLRPPPPFARAPRILPPTRNRCASACRPIPEWIAAPVRLSRGYLETLIAYSFRQVHRQLTLSPRCWQVLSAAQLGGQPLRKQLRGENLQPVGHAAPRGPLNPWQTNTSSPRDPARAAAMSRGIADAQPRRRPPMKGIPSCERLMPWRRMRQA